MLNAYFGCPNCEIRGEHIDGCGVRYTPSSQEKQERQEGAPVRIRQANDVEQPRRDRGVVGTTALARLIPHGFDPVWGFVIDAMHNIALGVMKRLMNDVWLEKNVR